jgi:hypothetical protein
VEEVGMVPAGIFLFALDAALLGGVGFEDIESDMT